MRRRTWYFLCGTIIVISVAIGAYDRFVLKPLRMQQYVISPWSMIYIYVAKPTFWICIGIILTFALFRLRIGLRFRKTPLWIGIAMIIAYCGIAVYALVTAPADTSLHLFLAWLLKRTPAFMIPGMLIGEGIEENSKSPNSI